MEKIINNPGLQHLAENVFWNLVVEDLKLCAQINLGCNQILKNPIFCLRKFEQFSLNPQLNRILSAQNLGFGEPDGDNKMFIFEKRYIFFLNFNASAACFAK